MRFSMTCLTALILASSLGGCQYGATKAPTPDLRIQLVPSADGREMRAVAPDCIGWQDAANSPNVNQRMPHLGCASARNLAAQVERPMDLVKPKGLGLPDATLSASSVSAYRQGKTKALIDPNAESPLNDSSTGAGSTESP